METLAQQPEKRGRGRPVGSTGKKLVLNRQYLHLLFKRHDFEPGEFLIQVASGKDKSECWTPRDRIKAAHVLMAHTYDRPQRESEAELIEQLRRLQQDGNRQVVYEVVYVQDPADFSLPPA